MYVITLRKLPRILTPFYLNPDYLKYSLPRPNYRSFFPSVSESDCLFSRRRSSSSSMFHSRALVHASSQPDVEAKVQKSKKSSIRFSSALSRSIAASSCLPSPPLINVSSCHFVPSGRVSARVSLFPRVECQPAYCAARRWGLAPPGILPVSLSPDAGVESCYATAGRCHFRNQVESGFRPSSSTSSRDTSLPGGGQSQSLVRLPAENDVDPSVDSLQIVTSSFP